MTENLLNNLFETSNSIISNRYGIIEEVSQAVCDLTGYAESELVGENVRIFNSGYHEPMFFTQLWNCVLEGNVWNGEIRNKTKAGSFIWMHISIFPQKNKEGVIERFLSTRYDITKRKEAEFQLLKSESRLREAQEISHLGNWELDIVNNALYWSDEIYRIFGTKPQSFSATYEAFLEFIHPEDRDRVNNAYSDSLIDKTPYHIIHKIITDDGIVKTVEENCFTEFDNKGIPIRSIGTVQDITDRLKGEKAIRDLEEKKAMFNEIHHRIKNNLVIISSVLNLQSKRSKNAEFVNSIAEARERINSIARIHEMIYSIPNVEGVVLKKYVEALFQELIKLFNRGDKEIVYSVKSDIRSLDIKTMVPVAMILNELVTNSLKYAFENKPTGEIKFSASIIDDKLIINYSDNGEWRDVGTSSDKEGYGTTLIDIFSEQLGGSYTRNTSNGTSYSFELEIEEFV